MRRARRGHDDIGVERVAQRPLEGDRLAAKARGELWGALHVPVRDIDEGDAVRDEMLRRELRHIARAEKQCEEHEADRNKALVCCIFHFVHRIVGWQGACFVGEKVTLCISDKTKRPGVSPA